MHVYRIFIAVRNAAMHVYRISVANACLQDLRCCALCYKTRGRVCVCAFREGRWGGAVLYGSLLGYVCQNVVLPMLTSRGWSVRPCGFAWSMAFAALRARKASRSIASPTSPEPPQSVSLGASRAIAACINANLGEGHQKGRLWSTPPSCTGCSFLLAGCCSRGRGGRESGEVERWVEVMSRLARSKLNSSTST